MNNDFPVYNGVVPSWADVLCSVTPDGAPLIEMKDIVSIKRAGTVTVGEQKAGGRVMQTTTGEVKNELTVVVYRTGFQKMIRNLAKVAPKRRNGERVLTLVHFGFQVQHTPPGSEEIFEWHSTGNRLIGITADSAEGVEADQVELPMHTKRIVDIIDGEEVVLG